MLLPPSHNIRAFGVKKTALYDWTKGVIGNYIFCEMINGYVCKKYNESLHDTLLRLMMMQTYFGFPVNRTDKFWLMRFGANFIVIIFVVIYINQNSIKPNKPNRNNHINQTPTPTCVCRTDGSLVALWGGSAGWSLVDRVC